MIRKWFTGLTIAILLLPFSCYANSFSQRLKSVVSQIDVTKKNLSQSEQEHKKLQNQLRKHDTNIGNLANKIATTTAELDKLEESLKQLSAQQNELQNKIDENQIVLNEQIKSVYMLGNKNTIKMLLNQENPNDFDRMLQYHRIIGKYRYDSIKHLNKTVSKINSNKHDIEKKSRQLAVIQNRLVQQKNEMNINHKNRRRLLYTLSKTIKSHREKLAELDTNKQQLEDTLQRLQTNKAKGSVFFTAHKHRLPWPTKGKIEIPFGTRIQKSHLKWSGVLLKAKEGDHVKAIAPGKVVFSNWMPGFGLLLIVDHGDGYMSLYGRNNSLYRSTGDWVKAGDLIASVGMSGGHSKPALYFSLRHKGKPLDPTDWCTKIGRAA